jgi:hypothetical protein
VAAIASKARIWELVTLADACNTGTTVAAVERALLD